MRKEDYSQLHTASTPNDLAIERTEYALERTQLAWIRTTLALLGTGIVLDKGMEFIHQQRIQASSALFESSHVIGIVLSMGSTIATLLTCWFSYRRFRDLAVKRGGKSIRFPVVLWFSLFITLLGISISVLLIAT